MRKKDHIVNEPFDDGRNYLSHADVIKIELYCDIRDILADIAGALTQLVAQRNKEDPE